MLQEIRFALRGLRKGPAFAITAVLTIALGISATTSIFTLIHDVVLQPLPFPEPDRLAWAQQESQSPDAPANAAQNLSYPDFFDWRAQNHSFTAIASYRNSSVTLTGSGDAQHIDGQVVSSEFFRVLGVHPIVGRDFMGSDEKAHVVMLSHGLWQSAFGSARDIAGRLVQLDGTSYVVAGVMPAGFAFPIQSPDPQLWMTLATDGGDKPPLTEQRGADMLDVVGRLKPGVSVGQAQAEMSTITRRLAAQYPATNKLFTGAVVEKELDHLTGDTKPAMKLLFGAVSLVLLIACANVAGLLLARASGRSQELAVRAALGAKRAAIVRQFLVESVCLSLGGGALGVLLSTWILSAMLRIVPEDLPRMNQVSVDGVVLAFATAVSVLTGLVFGVLPAWRASRLDPALALRESGRSFTFGRGQNRLHSSLVIAQTALSLVLLVGSGLLIRSFIRVLNVDAGFDPRHVLTARLTVPFPQYSREGRIQFYSRLLSQLAALPGVQSATAGWPLPLSSSSANISFEIQGHPKPPGEEPAAQLAVVTPGYFQTMRIPVLVGREFAWNEDAKARPVIIVNQAFARKYFPGENPIGKQMQSGLGDGVVNSPMREIVGVVGNIKRASLTVDAEPMYYLPWKQAQITSPALEIRTAGDPLALIPALRAQLSAMDKDIPLSRVSTLENAVYRAAARPRFQTVLVSAFAGVALLLAAVGLYGVLSYMVVQRTTEIGVRVALGAQRRDVLGWVVKRGLTLAAAGLAVGLGASFFVTRYLTDMLYTIKPQDSVTLVAVALVLLAVSVLASVVPAYRASRLDPMTALREQ